MEGCIGEEACKSVGARREVKMCVNERGVGGKVQLQGVEVGKSEGFKYLGPTVHSNGECYREVKERVQ